MGLPGHRRTGAGSKRRAQHLKLSAVSVNRCAQCGKARKPHRACAFCGVYKKK